MITSNIWTYTLTSASISINETFDLVILSILVTSGSCTISGDSTASNLQSTPVVLTEGQSLTISSSSGNVLLSGISITSSGTTILTGR